MLSRYERLAAIALALLSIPATPALGQAQTGSPPERIDLITTLESPRDARLREECEAKQAAAAVTQEIVVCGERGDDAEAAGWNKEDWENRYAARTQGAKPVDVDGPGIFRGEPTIGSLCIPGLQKCPPPPAVKVDFAALPQAPAGSDADRIARGLPPLGNDGAVSASAGRARTEALGLPPVPGSAEAVSPEGSEEPAAPQ